MRVAELGSQDAQDLKNVIYDSFKKNNFQKVSLKIIFLASDGASVNSGMKSGLMPLLKEDYWIDFSSFRIRFKGQFEWVYQATH